jgi:methylated-DNA-[protein]-cysteine S-methyltransferase
MEIRSPRFATFPTPLGPLTVASGAHGVVATVSAPADQAADILAAMFDVAPRRDDRGLAAVGRELAAYFAGELRTFETPVDLAAVGQGFHRRALEVVRSIPYSEMWTYGDVAAAAGSPRAARAAGSALHRCPVELFVPCHRVVPNGPGLGNYGGDEDRRAFLLRLEGAI